MNLQLWPSNLFLPLPNSELNRSSEQFSFNPLLVLTFALMSCFHIDAQEVQLRGAVLDSIGPLGFANVIATNPDSGNLAGYSITNNEGRYALSLNDGQTYVLRASFLGYQTQEKELTVGTDSADLNLDFLLKAEAAQLDGVEIYAGDDQFAQFMGSLDVLINVLPLTPATHHFLNEERLSLMPRGAKVINISRGAVIDEAALLALLNSGHIGGAALDVFSEEPLPDHSPLWQHPTVNITPHASGQTYVRSAIKSVVENIKKMKAGEQPGPLFDLTRGY